MRAFTCLNKLARFILVQMVSAGIVVAVIGLASPCLAQTDSSSATTKKSGPSTSSNNPGLSDSGWSNELLQRKLDETIDLKFDQVPWKEVELSLEDSVGNSIVLLSSAKDDSLTGDEPISFDVVNVRVRDGLRMLLREKNATFIVRNNVIQIISLDDRDDPQYLNNFVFDVKPLLATIFAKEQDRIAKPGLAAPGITAESLLIDTITTTYMADRWSDARGSANIRIIAGKAILFGDDALADGLKDFLKDLEHKVKD